MEQMTVTAKIPVSYTHLDVYKRQDRNCGSGIYRCSDYGKKEISKNDRRLQ